MAHLVSVQGNLEEGARRLSLRARRFQTNLYMRLIRLNPLRVLDSRGWPDLSRDSPLDSRFRGVPDNLQDLNVPMLSLIASVRDGLRQVRWGPKF